MIKIGCCGFCKAKQKYVKNFNLVEIQSTFYQPPSNLDTVRRWRQAVGGDFEFTIKMWQIATHLSSSPTYRRLKEFFGDKQNYGFLRPTPENIQAFRRIEEICDVLGAKIVVFQTPPNFKETEENINNIYKYFHKIKSKKLKFVWEERGGWSKDTLKKVCRDLKLVYCSDPFKNDFVYGDFIYWRLHGKGGYKYKYTLED